MKTICGMLVGENGPKLGVITYVDDIIKSVEYLDVPPTQADLFFSPQSHLIFPGFIDLSVNCREDTSGENSHKETFETAGHAAINGGVTQVCDHPLNPVPPMDKQSYDAKVALTHNTLVDVLLYAGIGPDSEPFGDLPYSVYMDTEIGDLMFDDLDQMDKTLERYKGLNVSFHCEHPAILDDHQRQRLHERKRPPSAELEGIKRALDMIHKHGLHGKICTVSTMLGVEEIAKAKASGLDVLTEVAPHHLHLDFTQINSENRKFLQLNPPLRSPQDRSGLLQHLSAGDIDFIASDHSPHLAVEKLSGISGAPHLDTYGQFLIYLMLRRNVDVGLLYKVACKNPGDWVGRFTDRKIGRIEQGYEATFSVLSLEKSASEGRPMQTKAGWSPFDLRSLPATVQTVFMRGTKVADDQWIKGVQIKKD